MLFTCSASTDVDLTTTGRVRSLVLGATATSTQQDATISLAIRAASRWAEAFVGYPLTAASYVETRPGFGRRNLMLSYVPLRAVPRVFDSTDTGSGTELASTAYRVEDRDAGFLSRDDGWAWTVPTEFDLIARPLVQQEYRPWMVNYVAGYVYGGMTTDSPNYSTANGTTSTGRTLPEDIEEAVAQRATAIITGDDDVVMEQLGDLKVQYRSERIDDPTPNLYEVLLQPYRRQK